MSDHGRALLTQWEGSRAKMYLDSAGKPTIGVGHLLTQSENASGKLLVGREYVRWTAGLTPDQIDTVLRQDLGVAENAVIAYVGVPLKQHQFDALVSFVFNSGAGALKGSTLRAELNKGRYDDVPAQLRRWCHATKLDEHGEPVKVTVPGLVNRRANECRLWKGEV